MGLAAQPSSAPDPDPPPRRFTPPWLFLIGMVPFGATSGHVVALSYLLEKQDHLPVATIAGLAALTFVPHSWKLLWAPLLDTWIRRRTWFLLSGILAALGTLLAFCIPARDHFTLLSEVLFGVNIAAATSNSALGAICATTVHPDHKGVASGCFSAGSLLSQGLCGGLIILLCAPPSALSRFLHPVPLPVIGIIVSAMILSSSLVILLVDEPPPQSRPMLPMLGSVLRDTWETVRSRAGWTGLLICLSPVGTSALSNLFGAIATDYQASSLDVTLATGLLAGLANAAGSVGGGWLADRMNRRVAYCVSGAMTAACALLMARAPALPGQFLGYSLVYALASGVAYATFYAFVFEMIETSDGATTKYGLFIGTSNLAISYVTYLDGLMYKHGPSFGMSGRVGMLTSDATLNLAGILLVVLMLGGLRRRPPVAGLQVERVRVG